MEPIVYQRLSTDTALVALCPTITPAVPEPDSPLPYVVYYVSGSEPQLMLGGVTGLVMYTVTVEVVAKIVSAATAIADRVDFLLNGKSWSGVQGSFQRGRETVPESDPDTYAHVTLTYEIWA